MLRYGLVQI